MLGGATNSTCRIPRPGAVSPARVTSPTLYELVAKSTNDYPCDDQSVEMAVYTSGLPMRVLQDLLATCSCLLAMAPPPSCAHPPPQYITGRRSNHSQILDFQRSYNSGPKCYQNNDKVAPNVDIRATTGLQIMTKSLPLLMTKSMTNSSCGNI